MALETESVVTSQLPSNILVEEKLAPESNSQPNSNQALLYEKYPDVFAGLQDSNYSVFYVTATPGQLELSEISMFVRINEYGFPNLYKIKVQPNGLSVSVREPLLKTADDAKPANPTESVESALDVLETIGKHTSWDEILPTFETLEIFKKVAVLALSEMAGENCEGIEVGIRLLENQILAASN